MRRNFGASMDNNGGEEGRRKATWKERKKLLKFAEGRERIWLLKKKIFFPFFFQKAMPHVPF